MHNFCFNLKGLRASALIPSLALLAFSHAHAVEYTVDYGISEKVEYESNPRLSTEDKDDLSGYTTSPNASFAGTSEKYEYGLGVDLDFSRFSRQEFNTDDQFVDAFYRRTFERADFNMSAGWSNQSSRTSEIIDATRRVDITERRENIRGNLGGSYQVNESNSLTFNGGYQEVENESESNSDYDSLNTSLLWRHSLSETFSLQLNFIVSEYDSERKIEGILGIPDRIGVSTNESDSFGTQIGFRYIPFENLDISLLVGETDVDTKQVFKDEITQIVLSESEQSNSSNLVNLTIDSKLSEKLSVAADLSQSVSASGDGFLQETNSIGFSGQYLKSPRLSGFASFEFEKRRPLNFVLDTLEREDILVKIGVSYRLLENLSLKSTYRFREALYGDTDSKAESNQIDFSLVYTPESISWSR